MDAEEGDDEACQERKCVCATCCVEPLEEYQGRNDGRCREAHIVHWIHAAEVAVLA